MITKKTTFLAVGKILLLVFMFTLGSQALAFGGAWGSQESDIFAAIGYVGSSRCELNDGSRGENRCGSGEGTVRDVGGIEDMNGCVCCSVFTCEGYDKIVFPRPLN